MGGDGALGGRAAFAEGGGTPAPEAAPFRYGAVGRKTKDSGRAEIGGLMAGSEAGRLYVWTVQVGTFPGRATRRFPAIRRVLEGQFGSSALWNIPLGFSREP